MRSGAGTRAIVWSLFQVSLEEVRRQLQQMLSRGPSYAVALLRIDHHREKLARPFQRVAHLQGVLKQDVVVLNIVDDQQLRL